MKLEEALNHSFGIYKISRMSYGKNRIIDLAMLDINLEMGENVPFFSVEDVFAEEWEIVDETS